MSRILELMNTLSESLAAAKNLSGISEVQELYQEEALKLNTDLSNALFFLGELHGTLLATDLARAQA